MGKETESDFDLDSIGQCFFCLANIVREFLPSSAVKLEANGIIISTAVSQSVPGHSLRYLFQYLDMDRNRSKIYQNSDDDSCNNPSHFMNRIEASSNLKVQLCVTCAILNDKFTGLCRKLEKVQMEVKSCVSLINGKLLQEEEKTKSATDFNRKLDSVEELRRETMLRCSRKLTRVLPRVKLTMVKIRNARIQKSSNEIEKTNYDNFDPEMMFHSNIGEVDIKAEVTTDFYLDSATQEDDCNNYMDDEEDPNQDRSEQSLGGEEGIIENAEMKAGGVHQINACQNEMKNEVLNPNRKYSPSQKRPRKRRKPVGHSRNASNANNMKHKCQQCGKRFQNRPNVLRHHQTAHVGVRFLCNLCNKPFTQRYHLESHIQTFHLKLPKFKCDICGRGFAQKSHLETHIKEVHLRERGSYHHCHLCQKAYKGERALRDHLRRIHKLT